MLYPTIKKTFHDERCWIDDKGDHDETREGVICGVSRDTPTADERRRRRLPLDPMAALRGGPDINLIVERGVDHDTARTMLYPLTQRPVLHVISNFIEPSIACRCHSHGKSAD